MLATLLAFDLYSDFYVAWDCQLVVFNMVNTYRYNILSIYIFRKTPFIDIDINVNIFKNFLINIDSSIVRLPIATLPSVTYILWSVTIFAVTQ